MVGLRKVLPVLRVAAAVSSAAVVVLVTALPASAAPLQHERYSGTDSFTECDRYQGDLSFRGIVTLKDATPATGGQFFYFTDNYQYREVVTNPDTGAFLTIAGNGQFKESHARLVEGTLFTFQTRESGQPFVISDSSGTVLLRDRGMIVQSVTFDSLGDSQPGGETLGQEVLRVSGPHPGFGDFDFCGFAESIIG
jgi:hypothetical protein